MTYCTHLISEAETFNSYTQADLFACFGFDPVHDGRWWRLRNANGDYIKSILAWWDHDGRAEVSYVRKYRDGASAAEKRMNAPIEI